MSSQEVPKTGRAAVLVDRGENYKIDLREDHPVPKPGKGQLLLRLGATGLCQSDVHFMKNDWHWPVADDCNIVGHEGAGRVVAIGEGVDPEVWKIGDRAGVKPLDSVCGECRSCRRGHETHCAKLVAVGAHVNGSYSEYAIVTAKYTNRIPEGLSDEMAAPILCSGGTVYAAIKRSNARAGQWLVIPGAGGGVGSMAVQYARYAGIRVLAIDAGDKGEMCKSLGAEQFIDFTTCSDIHGEVKKITNGGADAVIVTGGSKSAYENTHRMLAPGGTLVCIGMPGAGVATVGGDPLEFIMGGIGIVGSLVAGLQDVDEALEIAALGGVKLSNLHVHPFEELPELIKKLDSGKMVGRAVVKFDK
ncbi:hypothetical protein JCM8208_000012 [Rhodotorula glutinis]